MELPSPGHGPTRSDHAASFERGASPYAAARPSYPQDAVAWCVPTEARDVLDLAAGTGKLTAVLASRGLRVVAVEPADAMRAELTGLLPGIDARPGTAEATGLAAASVDAVTVAQAWHWFDEAAASAEVARVLRPGGTLATLWNIRDESVGWVGELSRLLHPDAPAPTNHRRPALGPDFGPSEHATFRWVDRLPAARLRDLAASRSHVLVRPDDERAALLDGVDRLVATHPALAGREEIELPYVTHCWRARREGRAPGAPRR